MLIKKYSEFILEKLGVPDGLIDSSKRLFSEICDSFRDLDDEIKYDGDTKIQFKSDIKCDININGLELSDVELTVTIYSNDRFENPEVISWGVVNPELEIGNKFKPVLNFKKESYKKLKLIIDFVSKEGNNISKLLDKLESEKDKNIGIVAHELKHFYDNYKFNKLILSNNIDYSIWSSVRTGFEEIDDFIFNIYFTSKIESLVRSSELAGEISSLGIKKSDFHEFFMKSNLYLKLTKMRDFKYENMKKSLLNNINTVRSKFEDIPEGEKDEDVVNNLLASVYNIILQESVDKVINLIDPIGIKRMLSIIEKEEEDFYSNFVRKRSFNSYDEFFVFWEKKINFEANKVIKKISKLYDMCEDDKLNPIMTKINQRSNDKCIVNPELYNEIVLGVDKNKKNKYNKKEEN